MNIKRLITHILVSFALISIGFALGKETTRRTIPAGEAAAPAAPIPAAAPAPTGGDDHVIVYYMHRTIRCVTCVDLENSIHDILYADFADALGEGRMEWRTADYEVDESLAKRYDVGFGCVVVVKVKDDGREAEFKRLDDIWTRMDDRASLAEYLRAGIEPFLSGG